MESLRRAKMRAPMRNACELADDIDDDPAAVSAEGSFAANEGDKENREGATKTTAGSENTAALKDPNARGLHRSDNAAKLESPTPAFEFKRGKTRFRKRKLVQREQQQQRSAADEKRIQEMIAYFARLDKQTLEVE